MSSHGRRARKLSGASILRALVLLWRAPPLKVGKEQLQKGKGSSWGVWPLRLFLLFGEKDIRIRFPSGCPFLLPYSKRQDLRGTCPSGSVTFEGGMTQNSL
jgi:hypothetical protein